MSDIDAGNSDPRMVTPPDVSEWDLGGIAELLAKIKGAIDRAVNDALTAAIDKELNLRLNWEPGAASALELLIEIPLGSDLESPAQWAVRFDSPVVRLIENETNRHTGLIDPDGVPHLLAVRDALLDLVAAINEKLPDGARL